MDEFAQLSRENFEVFQRYGDASLGPDPKHRAIAIYVSPNAPTTYIEKDLNLESLPKFFKARPSSGNIAPQGTRATPSAASLKLIVIDSKLESWSSFSSSLWVTKDVFLSLVDSMRMNPAALWLLRSEYDGFHHFPSSSPSSSPESEEGEEKGNEAETADIDTYYIGTSNFVLTWTFDRRRRHTHALWILRQQHAISNQSAPAAWFVNVLRRHQAHVCSPGLLAYAAALSVCCTFDGEISYRAHVVRLIERQTGYSTHSSSIEERIGMESLTVSIKEVGEVLNHIANKQRHFRLVGGILDFIAEDAVLGMGVGGAEAEGREDSTRKLVEAIPALRKRVHASQEYLMYLKERAERLSTVLFALLTHEDSAIHAELADASRKIAEASKRDSSSMKTVAIMTMAFLPATFFAALFSVPSLDWHADAVIQPNFWVYWAFTLPATALVFALWLLLDRTTISKRAGMVVTEGRPRDDEERPRSSRSKFE
ncbi:uncharacterized protein F4807DRAFT_460005 [Annulohypoxylon truncatum]|uniref:uncharacterized protein n=1 Tax=Annulohypoxylon truncatum TaxID=327061 RepID=UPI0020077650|nr:uncharacterized protein F4807DRAFT_460005 [Annulohypoxylon truncatum]KAI1210173.1 hypothetical protein F4807DRAFT_460005 [Annulohypoxylon truncatum]